MKPYKFMVRFVEKAGFFGKDWKFKSIVLSAVQLWNGLLQNFNFNLSTVVLKSVHSLFLFASQWPNPYQEINYTICFVINKIMKCGKNDGSNLVGTEWQRIPNWNIYSKTSSSEEHVWCGHETLCRFLHTSGLWPGECMSDILWIWVSHTRW